jgi:hypothetical protein
VIHLGAMGRLELQGEFDQRVRQQIAAAKINDGAVLRLAGILPDLKARRFLPGLRIEALPRMVPAADVLTAPFTSRAIRAVVSHLAQACAVSRPSSRNTSMPRDEYSSRKPRPHVAAPLLPVDSRSGDCLQYY